MTVTKITEISKSKLKITIDEEFAFVLYKGELSAYKIKAGCRREKRSRMRYIRKSWMKFFLRERSFVP